MILAAGRGERMRPLTDTLPKPLLAAGGKSIIQHHIEALVKAGLRDIVINLAWKGEMIAAALGDGARFGVALFTAMKEMQRSRPAVVCSRPCRCWGLSRLR